MSSEGFFSRWSRLKSQGETDPKPSSMRSQEQTAPPARTQAKPQTQLQPAPAEGQAAQRLPTLGDVARLSADSDFSAFVAPGVDKTVRRQAMKKLFSDPHFNIMDGLDIYIDDYTKSDPMPAAMLAALQHANSSLGRSIPAEDKKEEPREAEAQLQISPAAAPADATDATIGQESQQTGDADLQSQENAPQEGASLDEGDTCESRSIGQPDLPPFKGAL